MGLTRVKNILFCFSLYYFYPGSISQPTQLPEHNWEAGVGTRAPSGCQQQQSRREKRLAACSSAGGQLKAPQAHPGGQGSQHVFPHLP